MSDDLLKIEIDGKEFKAPRGTFLIEVADAAGITIPRFCYHKKLSVAANCRMCLVEVEKVPKPLPACATPVSDGMKVSTRSVLARSAQRSVMEFLLVNHPLDCPICDQGGECELQDVAMGFGGDVSRFQERKRVVRDKDLGSLISTDMTRCIHCTRCVRFGEEIAGLRELGATGRGEHMEIGTYVTRTVDSELSGNVIDLCPVGALTSKPFRFSARSWEMTQHRGVAPHDGVGSNLYLHVHRGRVKRVVPRDNERLNESWLSDRDRFSYEGVYASDRLESPMIKQGDVWVAVDWDKALGYASEGLRRVIESHGEGEVGALAAPGSTLEEFYLLQRLMRGLGSENVDHRLGQADFSDQDAAPLYPDLGMPFADLEQIDTVLVIGSHVRMAQPIANLRLRKASMRGAKVMCLNPVDYELNYGVAASVVVAPSAMVGALAGIAKSALGKGEAPQGALGELLKAATPTDEQKAVGDRLRAGKRVAVLLGEIAVAHSDLSSLRALAGLLAETCNGRLGYLSEANSAAGWLAGALPHRLAGGKSAASKGLNAREMVERGLKAFVLVGVEPEHDCWDSRRAREAMARADFVVALTAYRTPEMEAYADVLLPISTFVETAGTHVNMCGDWQSFAGAAQPPGDARPGWKVLRVLGNGLELDGFDYNDAGSILAEVKAIVGEAKAKNMGSWGEPAKPAETGDGYERIGEGAPYGVDPVVRRASALQATRDGAESNGTIRLNPETAKALGVEAGQTVGVSQGGATARLVAAVDARVADGCVLVWAGTAATAALGPRFGRVAISPTDANANV